MTAYLRRQGYEINHKRVQRLMQKMDLQAVYPKPRTTVPRKEHKIYPYLLCGLRINRPNQVWAAAPMCVCRKGVVISWTGLVAMCSPGRCPTLSMAPSACKPSAGPLCRGGQRSITPIRGTIHGPGFHRLPEHCWYPDQHVWPGSGVG